MQEVENQFQLGVLEEFRQKVHKIKPVFSFVGLTQLTELAEQLEKIAGGRFHAGYQPLYLNSKHLSKFPAGHRTGIFTIKGITYEIQLCDR